MNGIGAFCIDWAFSKCGNLRIDTHGDNIVMQIPKLLDGMYAELPEKKAKKNR